MKRTLYVKINGTRVYLDPAQYDKGVQLAPGIVTSEQCEGCAEGITETCTAVPHRGAIECDCGTTYSVMDMKVS